MSKLKIGDIVEIKTKVGLCYAQFTNEDAVYGTLIRVKNGFYQNRPSTINLILEKSTILSVFVPLRAMIKRKIVEIIGNQPISHNDIDFPMFKQGLYNPKSDTWKWWTWENGVTKECDDPNLLKSLPEIELINDTLLIEKIEHLLKNG